LAGQKKKKKKKAPRLRKPHRGRRFCESRRVVGGGKRAPHGGRGGESCTSNDLGPGGGKKLKLEKKRRQKPGDDLTGFLREGGVRHFLKCRHREMGGGGWGGWGGGGGWQRSVGGGGNRDTERKRPKRKKKSMGKKGVRCRYILKKIC